jgi:uncharacterized protein (TIGR03067 family)
VRGTAMDNEGIRRVAVNGQEARPLTANFAEWEIALDPPADGKLTAQAVDLVGNEEPRPHTAALDGDGDGLRTTAAKPEARELVAEAPVGGDAEGLEGVWRVDSQRRAGRPAERPRGMTWKIDGGAILLYPDGKAYAAGANADPRRQGGTRFDCRLGPAGSPGRIDLGQKLSVNLGIYKLEGDTLTICIGPSQASPIIDPAAKPDEQARPAEFSPEAGTVIVLRRVAP